MKYFRRFHISIIPLVLLTTCNGIWNFYPDPDDKGLTRFTSRGYGFATSYINGTPFMNTGSFYPLLHKDSGAYTIDTLKFTWPLIPSPNSGLTKYAYKNISFYLLVPHSFNKTNLLAFNGERFSNSVPVNIQDTSLKVISGTGTLYFVSVHENIPDSNSKEIWLSGLFDGNIGDSVLITKGRFDFRINEKELNF